MGEENWKGKNKSYSPLARLFIQSYNQAKCKQILKSDLSRRCLCEVMGQNQVCLYNNKPCDFDKHE